MKQEEEERKKGRKEGCRARNFRNKELQKNVRKEIENTSEE